MSSLNENDLKSLEQEVARLQEELDQKIKAREPLSHALRQLGRSKESPEIVETKRQEILKHKIPIDERIAYLRKIIPEQIQEVARIRRAVYSNPQLNSSGNNPTRQRDILPRWR